MGHEEHEELITRNDLNREIDHATMRIKFWVISGVLANFFVLTLALIPVVFYLGQIDSKIQAPEPRIAETARSDQGR